MIERFVLSPLKRSTMKRILLASTLPIAAAVFLGTPYYLGIQAQKSLTKQHQVLADTFLFDVVSHEYNRGWFSSEETTVVRFHPNILANLSNHLPNNIRTVLDKPVVLKNHVRHGLFANGIRPVRAVIDTELQYDPAVEKILARFFGNEIPATIHNVIHLDGSGVLSVRITPFDYEELSGIKLDWQGMDTEVQYQADFARYQTNFNIPALKAILADKGELSFEGISLKTDTRPSNSGIALGSSETKLNKFHLEWHDKLDYSFRLNELVNMVTDLQIGAFINPTGSIAPSKVELHDLSYTTQTDEQQGFINSNGVFSFAALNYGEDQYGPLTIDVAAKHIDATALNALKHRWEQIAMEKQDSNKTHELVLAAIRNEGAGIFTNNPEFSLNRFEFQTPQGDIKANGTLGFNNLNNADLEDFSAIVSKINANFHLDLAEPLLTQLAISQARNLFSTENPDDAQEIEEINETVRLMMDSTLYTLAEEGFLNRQNGRIATQINLSDNRLKLNDKDLIFQEEDDFLSQIENEEAQETPAENSEF